MNVVNSEIANETEQLNALQSEVETKRQAIEMKRQARMTELESELNSLRQLGIVNVTTSTDEPRTVKPSPYGRASRRKVSTFNGGRGHKIPDSVKRQVAKLVKQRKTGGAIAKELNISLPSVQNIKRALGLTQIYEYSR